MRNLPKWFSIVEIRANTTIYTGTSLTKAVSYLLPGRCYATGDQAAEASEKASDAASVFRASKRRLDRVRGDIAARRTGLLK